MESPFQAHLDTNYVPSDSDRARIEQFLQGPLEEVREIRAELKDVEMELEALRLRFKALNEKKQGRERFIARHRALLNPIRILPDEILRAVFDRCIPDRHSDTFPLTKPSNYMSVRKAPLLLTFICRRWREVAVDYPSLWDSPHIWIRQPSLAAQPDWNAKALKIAQLSRLWLSRAPDRPLDLTIVSPGPAHDSASEGLRSIWETLSASTVRWRSLQLDVAHELLDIILSVPSTSVPTLNQLRLSLPFGCNTTRAATLFSERNLIGGAALRDVRFYSNATPSQVSTRSPGLTDIPLQWHRLAILDVTSFPLTDVDVLHILTKTPAVERCTVRIAACGPLPPIPSTVILPKLVAVAFITHVNSTSLLTRLDMPKLRNALLVTLERGSDSLMAMVQQSQGKLRNLTVNSTTATSANIIHCLGLTPQLETLKLDSPRSPGGEIRPRLIADELLTALMSPAPDKIPPSSPQPFENLVPIRREREGSTVSEESPTFLCPNLTSIELNVHGYTGISDGALFEFIKRRRELRPQRLRAVTVVDRNHDPEMDIVEELKKQGVDIRGMSINLQYRLPRSCR
ncbi:hypothetical protein NMY22_g1513 [Coprinellus aureogranulatus]|nr:hypothetical protein NMY22_g1513 [Coprinellus aureogranulatus]